MQLSRSLVWALSFLVLSAMNLKAFRMQYLVISYFVLRSFLNLPAKILKAWRMAGFSSEKWRHSSSSRSSFSWECSIRNSIMALGKCGGTGPATLPPARPSGGRREVVFPPWFLRIWSRGHRSGESDWVMLPPKTPRYSSPDLPDSPPPWGWVVPQRWRPQWAASSQLTQVGYLRAWSQWGLQSLRTVFDRGYGRDSGRDCDLLASGGWGKERSFKRQPGFYS